MKFKQFFSIVIFTLSCASTYAQGSVCSEAALPNQWLKELHGTKLVPITPAVSIKFVGTWYGDEKAAIRSLVASGAISETIASFKEKELLNKSDQPPSAAFTVTESLGVLRKNRDEVQVGIKPCWIEIPQSSSKNKDSTDQVVIYDGSSFYAIDLDLKLIPLTHKTPLSCAWCKRINKNRDSL